MKLVVAIVDASDVTTISSELGKQGYLSTVLDAKGSFLQSDKSIILTGVSSVNVDAVIEVIGENSRSREIDISEGNDLRPSLVKVGGAVVMVLNVEQFQKL